MDFLYIYGIMKRILITFTLLIAGLPIWGIDRKKDSLAFVNADWTITELEGGATAMTARMQIFESAQSISIIKYPARRFRTAFIHSPGEMAGKTSEIAQREGMLMAMNGSYFNMRQLTPCTYFRIADQVLGETSASEGFRVNGVALLTVEEGGSSKGLPPSFFCVNFPDFSPLFPLTLSAGQAYNKLMYYFPQKGRFFLCMSGGNNPRSTKSTPAASATATATASAISPASSPSWTSCRIWA